MLLNIAHTRRKNMISLTPLIDVVFILLLFFMLSSTFSKWQQIALQTPVSSSSQTPDLVVVKIQNNTGELELNDKIVQINNRDELGRIVQQYSQSTMVLTAIKGVTVQTIVNVMDALKQSGASHISFAGAE